MLPFKYLLEKFLESLAGLVHQNNSLQIFVNLYQFFELFIVARMQLFDKIAKYLVEFFNSWNKKKLNYYIC